MPHGSTNSSGDPLGDSRIIQDEASGMGFDWPDITGVFEKVREELGEIEAALASGDVQHARRELGDVMFAVVNLGRFLGTDPAAELARTNRRFVRRFDLLKQYLDEEGRRVHECTLAELDAVWARVKKALPYEEDA